MANHQRSLKSESDKKSESPSTQSKGKSRDSGKTASLLDRLYNHLPLTCFILDESGTIISLNAWGVSQLGYTPDELRDRSIFNFIQWPNLATKQDILDFCLDDLNPLQQSCVSHISSGKSFLGKIQSKQGQCFYIKAIPSAIPVKKSALEQGLSAKICLICQDVTDDHLAWESQRVFTEELMHNTTEMILWLDNIGKIRRYNDRLANLTGYDSSEILGQNFFQKILNNAELFKSDSNVSILNTSKFLANLSFNRVQEYCSYVICKNGEIRQVNWKAQAIKDVESNHLGSIWVGVLNSVHQRSQINQPSFQNLPATEMLDNLPDLVALCDRQLRYSYLNSAMEKMIGVAANQALGKTNQQLAIPPDLAEAWQQKLRQVFLKGETIEEEFLLPSVANTDPTHQWYQVRWLPILGASGSVDWVLSIARNMKNFTADNFEASLIDQPQSEFDYQKINHRIDSSLQRLEKSIKKSNQSIIHFAEQQLIKSLQVLNEKMQQEIAHRRRLETALKENQERLSLIINTNADGLIIFDSEGCILFVNSAAAAIFGRHKKDIQGILLGTPVLTDKAVEIEIIQPHGKLAIAKMNVVEIPWSDAAEYDQNLSKKVKNNSQKQGELYSDRSATKKNAYLGSIRDVTDEKQAWEQVSWMKQAIESASDAIAITNRSGKVIYQNPAFSYLFEYKNCEEINQVKCPEELLKNRPIKVIEELKINLLPQTPLNALFTNLDLAEGILTGVRNGHSWQGEATMQSQFGKEMQLLLQADAIKDELGDIIGLICTYTDVTERRQSAEMLRKSLAQNQAIINTIPDALFRLKADGSYLDCNIGEKFHFCENPQKFIGKNCHDILPSFLAEEQMKAIALALKTKQVQVFEYQLVLPDVDQKNRLYDYEARVAPIGEDEVLTMVRDVSDKAEIQRSLQESEERYRTLAEASHDLIFIFNRDASIHYINIFAAHKLGSSPEKLVGQSIQAVFPGNFARELETKIYQVLGDKKQQTLEQQLDLYNVPIWLHISLVPLRNKNGIVTSVLAVAREITERIAAEAALKQSQEKLRQSEQQLVRTLATAPIGITTCDITGRFRIVNPALCQMLGYFAVQLRKMSLRDLVHEGDRCEFQTWLETLQTSTVGKSEQEYQLICKDGSEIIAKIRVAPIRDREGQAQQLVATVEDITDRKRSQEKLLLLSKAVESASDAIAITDCHGRSTYHNPAFENLFKFSAAELAELGGPQILYRDASVAIEVFDAILLDGSWQGEVEMFSATGATRQIFLRTDAIEDTATGQIVALLGIYRDITERKQAMDALAESEARFRTLADTAPVLIWLADADGNYTFFNQTWLQFTGRSFAEEEGQGWMSQIHADDFENCLQEYLRGVERSEPFRLLYRLRRVDGEYRWLLNTGVPRMTPAGNCAGYIGSCIDISDRKQLEEQLNQRAKQLERSNAELEQFAYVASHDLQEPLRTIASYTQLLAKRYQGQLDAKADKYIHYVVDGAQRMQSLIEDLLKYSRVSTQIQDFQPVNCQEIFEQAIANFQVAIRKAQAQIHLAPTCQSLPSVMGDRTQLLQLFQNLIGNAIKYQQGSVKPVVEVAAQRENGDWLFSIKDNGIGIDPKHTERIFLIFQRLHTRQEYHGTGIGLAVCQKIVERHQGRIWVASHIGKGSTFYFTLRDI